jgi:hypothetical protein
MAFIMEQFDDEISYIHWEPKLWLQGDDINLEQMLGTIKMLHTKYVKPILSHAPISEVRVNNGIVLYFETRRWY